MFMFEPDIHVRLKQYDQNCLWPEANLIKLNFSNSSVYNRDHQKIYSIVVAGEWTIQYMTYFSVLIWNISTNSWNSKHTFHLRWNHVLCFVEISNTYTESISWHRDKPTWKKLKSRSGFLVQLNGHQNCVTDLIKLQVFITKKCYVFRL